MKAHSSYTVDLTAGTYNYVPTATGVSINSGTKVFSVGLWSWTFHYTP